MSKPPVPTGRAGHLLEDLHRGSRRPHGVRALQEPGSWVCSGLMDSPPRPTEPIQPSTSPPSPGGWSGPRQLCARAGKSVRPALSRPAAARSRQEGGVRSWRLWLIQDPCIAGLPTAATGVPVRCRSLRRGGGQWSAAAGPGAGSAC